MPEQMRQTITVVNPKGSVVVSDGSSLRRADEVRPLTLGNTCEKLCMHALAVPLNRVAVRFVEACQFGFVPRRQIVSCCV